MDDNAPTRKVYEHVWGLTLRGDITGRMGPGQDLQTAHGQIHLFNITSRCRSENAREISTGLFHLQANLNPITTILLFPGPRFSCILGQEFGLNSNQVNMLVCRVLKGDTNPAFREAPTHVSTRDHGPASTVLRVLMRRLRISI